jgi:hypothetical protein
MRKLSWGNSDVEPHLHVGVLVRLQLVLRRTVPVPVPAAAVVPAIFLVLVLVGRAALGAPALHLSQEGKRAVAGGIGRRQPYLKESGVRRV